MKVSGSKGLPLSVPLNTEVTYEISQPFAKTIAELAEQQLPKQVVSAMAKTLRRGKVLIDWSQNSDFKTTVCVYAMRAKEGGPFISMPVAWEELAKAVKTKKPEALFFKPDAAVKRIKRSCRSTRQRNSVYSSERRSRCQSVTGSDTRKTSNNAGKSFSITTSGPWQH